MQTQPSLLAQRVSAVLAVWAAVTSVLAFTLWRLFHRDVPAGVGNMRGTALCVLVLAVPLLVGSMWLAKRGSLRAWFAWLGVLAYLAYNGVMFSFAAHFNALFLAFAGFLSLSFWALLTLLRAIDLERVLAATHALPVRTIAIYLLVSSAFFAFAWLQAIVPATLDNSFPKALAEAGLQQNPVWVLDFAFTFPLMVLGSRWLWQRRAWGFVVSGMLTLMLTLETIGVAVDQVFGHLHDPSASLEAVPVMVVFSIAGVGFSVLFLRGVRERA